jgi:hypothetical protein
METHIIMEELLKSWSTEAAKGISTVRSRYQATSSEDIADLENFEYILAICGVCRTVEML